MSPSWFSLVLAFFASVLVTSVDAQEHELYSKDLLKLRSNAVSRALTYLKSSRDPHTQSWKPEESAAALIGLVAGDALTWVPGHSRNATHDLEVQATYLAARYGILRLLERQATLHHIDHSTLVQMIGALVIMCEDPRDFEGHDLVQEMVDRHRNTRNNSPGLATLYLGHCLAEVPLSLQAVRRMHSSRKACLQEKSFLCFESAAITMLAASCMSRRSSNARVEAPEGKEPFDTLELAEVVKKLAQELRTHKMTKGSFGHLYKDALALQLLSIWPTLGDGVWDDPSAILRNVLKHQNKGEPLARLAGSFGGSPSFTALVVPALTEVTADFIADRKCPERKQTVPEHFIAVDYMIRDGVGKSQSLVGTFYAAPETEVAVALERFARKNPELITLSLERTFFGPQLVSLNGINSDLFPGVGWRVFLTDGDFRPVSPQNGLTRAVVEGVRLLFSFERGANQAEDETALISFQSRPVVGIKGNKKRH